MIAKNCAPAAVSTDINKKGAIKLRVKGSGILKNSERPINKMTMPKSVRNNDPVTFTEALFIITPIKEDEFRTATIYYLSRTILTRLFLMRTIMRLV